MSKVCIQVSEYDVIWTRSLLQNPFSYIKLFVMKEFLILRNFLKVSYNLFNCVKTCKRHCCNTSISLEISSFDNFDFLINLLDLIDNVITGVNLLCSPLEEMLTDSELRSLRNFRV